MSIELIIAIAGLIGLAVGLAIDRNARAERNKRIGELEKELTIIDDYDKRKTKSKRTRTGLCVKNTRRIWKNTKDHGTCNDLS